MAYSLELKKQVLERMNKEKIQDIALDTGISVPTLYKWRKEQPEEKKEKTKRYNEKQEDVDLIEQEKNKQAEEQVNESIEVEEIKIQSKDIKKEKVKKITSKDRKVEQEITIEETLNKSLKDVIKEIKKTYYVQMGLLSKTKETQGRYIKKYDKLETILQSKSNNKRAQMELMLVLINEGYKENVQKAFPTEDYEFIDGIIKQYETRTLHSQEAKKSIDEYCL